MSLLRERKSVFYFAGTALVLALALVAVYWQTLQVSDFFWFDSDEVVTRISQLKITSLDSKSLNQIIHVDDDRGGGNRVLGLLSLGIDYYFHGMDGRFFRATNLVILILSAMGVIWFAYLLCNRWTDKNSSLAIALATGVLWALHPLQTNIVAYIVQRITTLAILGYFFSLGFFILGELKGKLYWLLAAFFAVFALLSKEIVMFLPFAIALYRIAWDERAHNWAVRQKWPLLAGVTLPLAGVAVATWKYYYLYTGLSWEFNPWQRLITEARVLWHYIGLLLLPLPSLLNMDHDVVFSSGLLTPISTLLAIVAHAAVVALAFWLWKRHRLSALLIFLYYFHHLIESTTLGLDLMFEHRMSLPMVFLCILFSWWLWHGVVSMFGENKRARFAFTAVVLFISLLLGGLTASRLEAWSSTGAIYADIYAKSPDKARVVLEMGKELLIAGDQDSAEKVLRRGMAVNPESWEIPDTLALMYADKGMCNKAVPIASELLMNFKAQSTFYRVLAVCAENSGDLSGAVSHHRKSLELEPRMMNTRLHMARIYSKLGRLDITRSLIHEELGLYPGSPYALKYLNLYKARD